MRVVVYGGRRYFDRDRLYRHLDQILAEAKRHGDHLVIIEGMAVGADMFARDWAIDRHVTFEDFPARWSDLSETPCKLGRSSVTGKPYNVLAGFNRNQRMIDVGKPDFAVACPGGKGTRDMTGRLNLARVPIFLLQ